MASSRRFTGRIALLVALPALLAASGAGVACLPADTRPPPGSILITVESADEPSVTTADGWTIAVDRLLIGLGDAGLLYPCDSYSEPRYMRLLDGRLAKDQKVVILHGLGQCDFGFRMGWPTPESVLGEGVEEADRARMVGDELRGRTPPRPGPPSGQGIALDFAATATRDGETKRLHWLFNQPNTYLPCTRGTQNHTQSIALRSDENLTLRFGLHGAALFNDHIDRGAATLRFDAIAAADTTFGNADGEVTLDELSQVTIAVARGLGGAYVGRGDAPLEPAIPTTLDGFIHLVTLRQLVVFPDDITCGAEIGVGRPPR